jgi:hypothetical protein
MTNAKVGLEEERRATALDHTLGGIRLDLIDIMTSMGNTNFRHDGDSVSENVSLENVRSGRGRRTRAHTYLIHEVGREENGAAGLVLKQKIPRGAACGWIHARCGLIQNYHL